MRSLIAFVLVLFFSMPVFAQEWQVLREEDPITGAASVTAGVEIPDGYGVQYLALICMPNGELGFGIGVNDYIGNEPARLDYRFDDREPRTNVRIPVSNDGTMLVAFSPTSHEWFVNIYQSEQLVLRWYDFRGVSEIITFPLIGSADALEELDCASHLIPDNEPEVEPDVEEELVPTDGIRKVSGETAAVSPLPISESPRVIASTTVQLARLIVTGLASVNSN